MPYQIKFTETTNPAKPSLTVQDQSLNAETSLTFPGKNYAGYAPVIAENFLHLLENFAKNTAPSNPVQGQLWYDNTAGVNLLKVYDGTGWTAAGTVKKASSAPSVVNSIKGDLWVDTENQQLYVYSGSNWLLVGPQYSSGLQTGPVVETITDTSNTDRNVVSLYSENYRIAIVSKTAFTPKTTIPGFASVGQGINLSTVDYNSTTAPSKFWGTASQADALMIAGSSISAGNFLRKDVESTTNFPLNVSSNGGITIGTNKSFSITSDTSLTLLQSKTSDAYIEVSLNNAGTFLTAVHINANGRVGLGPNNTAPAEMLDVLGNIKSTGSIYALGTSEATTLGTGAIQTNGGLSVQKKTQLGDDVTVTNGTIYLNNLDSNDDPTVGTVISPASDLATDLYDIGSSTRRFRNIYAQSFIGNFNGSFTGSLSGNISGSAAKLASPTTFRIRGDVETSADVIFDGQSQTGVQTFTTEVSATLISSKTSSTDSFLSDKLVVYREDSQDLRKISKQTFISNIPLVPIGAIFPFAGETPPNGYLFCDGSELLIGEYSSLFAVIQYIYKTPSELKGKATFALPDFRGRFPLGRDNMDNGIKVPDKIDPTIDIPTSGGSANRVTDVVADTLGAGTNSGEYKTLTLENIPDHKHNLNSGYPNFAQYYAAGLPGAGDDPNADPNVGMPQTSTAYGLRNSGSVIASSTGQAFNVMNPYATINYIIFTGEL